MRTLGHNYCNYHSSNDEEMCWVEVDNELKSFLKENSNEHQASRIKWGMLAGRRGLALAGYEFLPYLIHGSSNSLAF